MEVLEQEQECSDSRAELRAELFLKKKSSIHDEELRFCNQFLLATPRICLCMKLCSRPTLRSIMGFAQSFLSFTFNCFFRRQFGTV